MKAGTGQRMRLTARQLKSFDLNLLVALDALLIAHGRELRLSAHARALADPVRETLAMLRAMLRTHSG